jgi:hypothetical protein
MRLRKEIGPVLRRQQGLNPSLISVRTIEALPQSGNALESNHTT